MPSESRRFYLLQAHQSLEVPLSVRYESFQQHPDILHTQQLLWREAPEDFPDHTLGNVTVTGILVPTIGKFQDGIWIKVQQ